MKDQKTACRNMNHGRPDPRVNYCPGCGETFRKTRNPGCDEEKHRARRKERNHYCHDCGKDLSR